MNREIKESRFCWGPYVLEDDERGPFVIAYRGNILSWKFYKIYETGKQEISRFEFRALKELMEFLYGKMDLWGDFVPGQIQATLPECYPDAAGI